jgi:hypothetical protein
MILINNNNFQEEGRVTIIVSKRIYTPVDRVVKRIKKQRGLADKNIDSDNEMSILYNTFDALEKYVFNQLSLGDKEATIGAVTDFFSKIRCRSSQGLAIDNVIQIIHQVMANTIKYLFIPA